MNSQWNVVIIRFIMFVLLQVLLFSKLAILGTIVPYLYIYVVLFLPIYVSMPICLLTAFLLGVCIDVFHNTGGAHAVACVTAVYCRPRLLAAIYGVSYEFNNLKLQNSKLKQLFSYIFVMTLIHHTVLYHLEVFDWTRWFWILKQTLYSGLYTIFLIYLTVFLFRKKYL